MFEEFRDELRQDWQVLKAAPPGERFQRLYWHRRQSRRSSLVKVGMIALGLLLAIAGLIMLVTPGPGMVFVLIGSGLLAQESLLVSRATDAAEFRIRPLAARIARALRRVRRTS
jgi:putative transmembrane protein PGPGW